MARAVKAFKSDDGQLYSSWDQAVAADLIEFVKRVSDGETSLDIIAATYIVKNSDLVIKILLSGESDD